MRKQFEIPKSFEIMGETYVIKREPDLIERLGTKDMVGCIEYDQGVIKIQEKTSTLNRSEDSINCTYLHEVVHCVLHTMRYNKMNADEDFVDLFAGLLYQILKTSEFEKGEKK